MDQMDTIIMITFYRAAVSQWVWHISKNESREGRAALTVPVGPACNMCCKSDVL